MLIFKEVEKVKRVNPDDFIQLSGNHRAKILAGQEKVAIMNPDVCIHLNPDDILKLAQAIQDGPGNAH